MSLHGYGVAIVRKFPIDFYRRMMCACSMLCAELIVEVGRTTPFLSPIVNGGFCAICLQLVKEMSPFIVILSSDDNDMTADAAFSVHRTR